MSNLGFNALPEIPINEATGVTLEIYQSIESALGVRLVNLVYRHLATFPGALEWAWAVVGAGFQQGVYRDQSCTLIQHVERLLSNVAVQSKISMKRCGLNLREMNAIKLTLAAYNRANPMNALSLRVVSLALSAQLQPSEVRTRITEVATPIDLLPISGLQDLDRETYRHISCLTRYTTGEGSKLVPSLFRHFIPWPDFLAEICDWLQPLYENGLLSEYSRAISLNADSAAQMIFAALDVGEGSLGAPDEATSLVLSNTIKQFLPAISSMIIIGGLLNNSIEGGLKK